MTALESYFKTKLNDEQYAASLHTSTSALILAGAGSGKTRVLTYKIANLIFWHDIALHNILAVTFTNKAAKEMKERLIKLSHELSKDIPGTRQLHFSRSNNRIWTFHSIFLRILKEDIDKTDFWFTKNFWIYDTSESLSLIKQIMKADGVEKLISPKEVKNTISRLKNEWTTSESYLKIADSQQEIIVAKVYDKYQTQLQIANAMDFDDLLLYPYRMFRQYPDILDKRQIHFSHILVDEAQDTNRIQFELMKLLTKHDNYNISLIGDDFQSIYGRRGALMENFLNVKKIWPDIEVFKLQTNYRSKPHIVAAGSAVIKYNNKQYEKIIIADRTGNEKILMFNHTDESSEALNIVEFISRLKEERQMTWSDFAILYRTNAQSSPFEQVLVQEGIPYKIFWAFKFFDRKEVKDIVSYLKYSINPRDNVALKRIINIPSRRIGNTTIQKIENLALIEEVCMDDVLLAIDKVEDLSDSTKDKIKNFNILIKYLRNKLETQTPAEFIKHLISQISYKAHLLKEEWWSEQAADERYENIGQLINMAGKYEEKWAEWLQKLMDEISLLTDAADASNEDLDSIKLMTIHSSKWLEFPNVFIVGTEENVFPLGNARLEIKLLEEERRLMYVAITRAQDNLFISYADSRMQWWQTMYNKPSRFLEEIPEELTKTYSMAEHRSFSRPQFDEWDRIKHKLFGTGTIIEIRGDVGIIRFDSTTFGVRKVPLKLVDMQ